jgi:hypothetical protein
MIRSSMRVLVLSACALATIPASGQDYVVTTKGDTLRGVVKIYTYDVIDRVQVGGGKEKGSFTAVQVREASILGEIYHPVRTESSFMMMKLVTPGFVSIYHGHQPKNYTFDTPYLVKKTGQAIEVPNLSFKKIMTDFLVECNVVREKVKDGELGRRDINKIVEEFNQCTTEITNNRTTTVATVPDSLLAPLTALRKKLENDHSLPNQKDALDILNDITQKVRSNQSVPKYLQEGLKDQLKDLPAYQQDIERVIAAVNNQ